MAKTPKTRKNVYPGGYKVAGKLRDGVIVLQPKTKPKSFTSRQIRETITRLRLSPGIAETRGDRRSKKG